MSEMTELPSMTDEVVEDEPEKPRTLTLGDPKVDEAMAAEDPLAFYAENEEFGLEDEDDLFNDNPEAVKKQCQLDGHALSMTDKEIYPNGYRPISEGENRDLQIVAGARGQWVGSYVCLGFSLGRHCRYC